MIKEIELKKGEARARGRNNYFIPRHVEVMPMRGLVRVEVASVRGGDAPPVMVEMDVEAATAFASALIETAATSFRTAPTDPSTPGKCPYCEAAITHLRYRVPAMVETGCATFVKDEFWHSADGFPQDTEGSEKLYYCPACEIELTEDEADFAFRPREAGR